MANKYKIPLFKPKAKLAPSFKEDSAEALHMGHCATAGTLTNKMLTATIENRTIKNLFFDKNKEKECIINQNLILKTYSKIITIISMMCFKNNR